MSADSWAECPRCTERLTIAHKQFLDEVEQSYGIVPAEEYLELLERAKKEPEWDARFREDYEFYGAETGVLKISYCGQCQTCGLLIKFKHEIPFYVDGKEIPYEPTR